MVIVAVLFTAACWLWLIVWRMWVMTRLLDTRRSFASRGGRKRGRGCAGYLYAFSDRPRWWWLPSGTIKIGRATDPKDRLAAHQTAAPHGLRAWWVKRVPDDVGSERAFHNYYLDVRVRDNGEWFYMTPMVLIDTLVIRWLLQGRWHD